MERDLVVYATTLSFMDTYKMLFRDKNFKQMILLSTIK